jgi:hypothetical protein
MWFSPGWDIKTQAAFWSQNIRAARRAGLGRPDYLEIRYEDLILNTRAVLEQICSFAGLSYEDSMLTYYQRSPARLKEHQGRCRPDGTVLLTREQRFLQQRRTTEPPDPTAVFSWKRLMSEEEQKQFQMVAGDLLEELNYEV